MANEFVASQVAAGQGLQGLLGTSARLGTMEAFGWNVEGFGRNATNYGFLGHKKWGYERRGEAIPGRPMSGISSSAKMRNAIKQMDAPAAKTAASGGMRGTGRAVAGTIGRSLNLAMTAYFMYEGYQEEGVWGAVKGAAESVAYGIGFQYAAGAASNVLGMSVLPWVAAVGAPIAAVGGAYALGQAGRAHARGLRQMEMSGGDQIQAAISSAGAATMRQRSLMALNNTHLNGRMALGNEGFLTHRSFA